MSVRLTRNSGIEPFGYFSGSVTQMVMEATNLINKINADGRAKCTMATKVPRVTVWNVPNSHLPTTNAGRMLNTYPERDHSAALSYEAKNCPMNKQLRTRTDFANPMHRQNIQTYQTTTSRRSMCSLRVTTQKSSMMARITAIKRMTQSTLGCAGYSGLKVRSGSDLDSWRFQCQSCTLDIQRLKDITTAFAKNPVRSTAGLQARGRVRRAPAPRCLCGRERRR